MTWSGVMVALDEKCSTHGDTATQTPAARVSHSGHSANTASAVTASAAIMMPLSQAFQFIGLSAEIPTAQGEKNRPRPITRLTTSAIISFFQPVFMAQLLT